MAGTARQAGTAGCRDGGSGGVGGPPCRAWPVAVGQAEQRDRDGDNPDARELGAAKPLVQHQAARNRIVTTTPEACRGLRDRQRFPATAPGGCRTRPQQISKKPASPRRGGEQGARQVPEPDVPRWQADDREPAFSRMKPRFVDDRGRYGKDDPGDGPSCRPSGQFTERPGSTSAGEVRRPCSGPGARAGSARKGAAGPRSSRRRRPRPPWHLGRAGETRTGSVAVCR